MSRILGRLLPFAFSHIPRYAPFSKCQNPLQGCDPYSLKILRNKLLEMKRIAISGNRHQDGYFPELQQLVNSLALRDFSVFMRRRLADYLRENGVQIPDAFQLVEDFPEEAQCVISLGGDGTFLKVAQWVGNREIPILGINTGHLGYLASYSLKETDELLGIIEGDRGEIERRALLEVKSNALPSDFWPYALNEVAVLKAESASMVTVHAEIDGGFLADYLADGLVVSTPTGSTAYNLSAGGPILQPTLRCVVLSPIAPHSLTMRPLVVAGTSEISLRATSRSDYCRVSLDGRSFVMKCGEELRLSRASFSVMLMRRPDANFARLLRSKLLWGKR